MNEPMTIIEGLKKIKLLKKKHASQVERIKNGCAELDYEDKDFTYGKREEQEAMIAGFVKSANDIIAEIENISLRISKTNIETDVTIELNGRSITKSISAWIMRRRELSKMACQPYYVMDNRGLQPKGYRVDGCEDMKVANVALFYNQKERDDLIIEMEGEPLEIDGKLEVVNATTQLLQI